MKAVILCGGMGTRLKEETEMRPKPMVTIGRHPILWHIMNIFSAGGVREFVLALGYKGESIKEYFLNYYNYSSDLVIDLKDGKVSNVRPSVRDWRVHLVDTGLDCMTGGRLLRLKETLGNGPFMLTYGDGVADIDVRKVIAFHNSHGKAATVTAVRPAARFGNIVFQGDKVAEFKEKPQTGEGWINGGFFVFSPKVFDYLADDTTVLEAAPLERLAREGELMAYRHAGFWHCMDIVRDRDLLNRLWSEGNAPWKIWD